MKVFDDGKISKLQKNLAVIRKVAGWTAEDLGDRIGVSRQTISNLEKSTVTTMTKKLVAGKLMMFITQPSSHLIQ